MKNNSRRNFLSAIGTAAVGTVLAGNVRAGAFERLGPALNARDDVAPAVLAKDEAFWAEIRKGFELPDGVVNLDNGYCNPLSSAVADELVSKSRFISQLPAKRLESVFAAVTEKDVMPGVARLLGVPQDEIAMMRNATDALDTVILGLPLKAGDEIVCCAHDYYAMLDAIEQRRGRDGIVVKMIRPPLPAPSADAIVKLYESAITPKTKLVLVTHASNTTGQIYPAKRIAAAAHRAGAEVIVDGAQTMALLDYKVPDLDCDYYGSALHKWLMAPVGNGVLWMKKEHRAKVWPLVPPPAGIGGMLRFMWCGTFPEFISAATAPALAFHEKLGTPRKEARIRHLTNYWRSKVEKLSGVKFYTTLDPGSSCGLGIFEVAGTDLKKVQQSLWEKDKILVQHMDGGERAPELKGIRVTPNVYTTPAELDRFTAALERAIKRPDA